MARVSLMLPSIMRVEWSTNNFSNNFILAVYWKYTRLISLELLENHSSNTSGLLTDSKVCCLWALPVNWTEASYFMSRNL